MLQLHIKVESCEMFYGSYKWTHHSTSTLSLEYELHVPQLKRTKVGKPKTTCL